MTQHMKSSLGKSNDTPALCEVLDLSSMLPEDLNGLPFRFGGDTAPVTRYAPQSWLHRLCQPDAYGVLVLDDLPAAAPAVQVASRQLSLERRVHEAKLSPNIMVIVTGNRREDKSSASTLPAHFRNSVALLDIQIDLEEWCTWYGEQEGLDPVVPAFLRYRPTHLSHLPKDADQRGAFATPRSWMMLGRNWPIAQSQGVGFDLSSGLVGEGVATEFGAFVTVRANLVDPKSVLANPRQAIPDPKHTLSGPDKMVAMTTGLGEVAGMRMKDKADTKEAKDRKKETPLQFLKAVAWVTQSSREYVATAVSTFTSNGGDVQQIVTAARQNHNDPDIKSVIDFLASTFNRK